MGVILLFQKEVKGITKCDLQITYTRII